MSVFPVLLRSHRIADITFQTESDVNLPHILGPAFAQFQVENAPADVIYRIKGLDFRASALPPLTEEERKQILRVVGFPHQWLDRPVLNYPEVRKKIEACLENPEMAHIGLRWERAIVSNFSRNELDFFYPPKSRGDFSNSLMIARYRNTLSKFLPTFSAVMLHGAGIIRNDLATLFLAPDEGGKSTAVRLAEGMPVLSDDQVILRRQEGVVMAHGTPFAPVTGGPIRSRLGSIFLLEKAQRFALSPVSVSEALQFIWNEHIHHWYVMPKRLRVQAFELLADACQQARIYQIRFSKDYLDWEAIDKILQN
jgi:hypothetical protein